MDENEVLYTRAAVSGIRPDVREVDVEVSNEALDSHGTIVRQNWDLNRYNLNPVVLWSHNASEVPLGRATKLKVSGTKGAKRLTATLKFREEGKSAKADEVWSAVEDGTLKGISAGFYSRSQFVELHDSKEVLVLDNNELVDISVTAIPSNPTTLASLRARALASKDQPPEPKGSPKEGDSNVEFKIFARALGLPLDTPEAQIEARVTAAIEERSKLLEATGDDTVDAAIGTIAAGKAAVEQAQKLQQQMETNERTAILERMRANRQTTPALEKDFLSTLSLESLRSYEKSAPKVLPGDSGLQQGTDTEVGLDDVSQFRDMSDSERSALKKQSPEEYNRMRTAWREAGAPAPTKKAS